MAYVINDNCINCGVCKAECPTACITEGETKHEIAAADCIDCELCAGVCPVEACVKAE
jgi:ferredoxin